MKYSKPILAAAALVGITGLGAVSAAATAHDVTDGREHPPIVKRMAETFNLDENKVHEVFVQEHQARHEQRQENLKDRLDQAVKDGKITEEQKTKLLEKMDQLREERQAMTWEQRRESRGSMHEALKQWAEDNGIDLDSLGLEHGPGPGGHHQR
jgi:hypothetical protein